MQIPITTIPAHSSYSNVKKRIMQLRKDLKELKNKKLEYIMVEKKKQKPLGLYEPWIEAVYVKIEFAISNHAIL